MLKETYFLLFTPPPPLCTPSSIDLITSVSSLGLRFAASKEAINNNAFINTNGLEIIFYTHSDGLHLCLQGRSACTNQTVKWMNKLNNFLNKRNRTFFFFFSFQSVLFKWMFDSNDSESLIQIKTKTIDQWFEKNFWLILLRFDKWNVWLTLLKVDKKRTICNLSAAERCSLRLAFA